MRDMQASAARGKKKIPMEADIPERPTIDRMQQRRRAADMTPVVAVDDNDPSTWANDDRDANNIEPLANASIYDDIDDMTPGETPMN